MPQSATLRLVLVDDHPLFVRGLELLLPASTQGRARVVGSTGDAAAAAALVRRCLPDLALVDLHMPPPGGIRAIAAIRRTTPKVRVVAFSGLDETDLMAQALRAGADGYLPKSSEPEELLPPLMAVLDGWAVLPAGLLNAMLRPTQGGLPATAVLDDGERQLLQLIAKGCRTVEIAERLHLSDRTVKWMTAALLRKLRVSNRTEAAAMAGIAGLL
ncbi:DNA-binding response regulator, NarL/FixJ family, contains REC and HTH domains [Micromonospora phaseoli]|uniref:DNA-binding response regulator, NarL/FixJ family, contains REC and HTH domains n=1 Tax=Micromonospora phaseoli TaxID=1144548 RepID=A0A1H6Z9Q6_9ACTN|nr:response regulator transcription factor [Micromonospora phaseoli]PZW00503.1 LuxR family two component transcriptional regulator [Micromonospora phaseoli]GIJ80936.1 DNA-binding response regulator [Micromonospora phaseoli]SEJ46402.1 DNA-binding response regulator, NarL/FixJ family, contains REC and HTH domains [Micromonospora phaseoli]